MTRTTATRRWSGTAATEPPRASPCPPPPRSHNATFLDIGGSPYEGTPKPRCDTKLVGLNNGKSIVPTFNVFTDVPVPTRMRGLIVDDINFSTDPRSTMYGEKAGVPFVPVGIYDYQNRLEYTAESDFNGVYDVLMPSTNHISCPTPSGVCANMYRFVANDPGVPGRLNPNFNPRYRVIATEFEALPGVVIPTDLAPTQVGLTIESPATGLPQAVTCPQSASTPQLMAVSRPYVNGSGAFTIQGLGFGATKGTGSVTLDGTALPTTAWSDTSIDVTVPAGTPPGAHRLRITADNGLHTANGLTFHVLGTGYNPTVREVGPGRTHATIQGALDAAFANNGDDLVVVYPGTPDFAHPRQNPRGAYYENLIMASPVKLQGVGPGGFQGNTFVPGSIIDASAFGGDSALATDWYTKIGSLTWDGNQDVNDGEAVYVLASRERHHRRRPGPAVHQRLQGRHRRLRHPRRRPAGLPGQHQRPHRRSDRAASGHRHAGRRDLRQRLRPQPADHQQRGRRTTEPATARSGSARRTSRRRTPTSTTRTCGSPTTASSTTPAPTSPAASGSSPARTATRSPATTCAGTSRWSTAAASASTAAARTARSTTTASTSTCPTTRAGRS